MLQVVPMSLVSRRRLIALAALLPGLGLLARAAAAPPTPSCGEETPANPEGPFYTPGSPRRSSLVEPGGERFVLEGRVVDGACRPLPGAVVDLWHAGPDGAYDNDGYRWRGHQFTDADGRWRFETVVPGHYPGRTRHFHVKVAPPDRRSVLTTQLYFPDDPRNPRDGLFRPDLVMETSSGVGRYDFVLDVG